MFVKLYERKYCYKNYYSMYCYTNNLIYNINFEPSLPIKFKFKKCIKIQITQLVSITFKLPFYFNKGTFTQVLGKSNKL